MPHFLKILIQKMQKNKRFQAILRLKSLVLVELVGIEPTSYTAAKKLSTYLVGLLFLRLQRGQTRFANRR